jgi:hypothetical protein
VPRLSIVIPLSGTVQHLEDSLVSVLENRPADCEIIVVLNRRYDDPYELHDEVTFVRARRGSGLVQCINLGIESSRSEVVHLLRCGTEVNPGWADAALVQFHDPAVGVVAPLVLRLDDPQRVVSAGWEFGEGGAASARGAGTGVDDVHPYPAFVRGPDHRAVFFRKSALELIGPCFRGVGGRWAPIDRALMLEQAGFRTILEPRCQVRAADEAEAPPLGLFHGLHAERMFWRWNYGPRRLLPLVAHLGTVVLETLAALPRPALVTHLAGRALACCDIFSYRRHRDEMAMWREHARRTGPAINGPHFDVGRIERKAG